jgi:hypothetical protein
MPNVYYLVNPYIEGTVKNRVKTNNSHTAATQLYKNVSEHFNNSIRKFYFTIQKGGSGKYYHFEVKENKDNDAVNYSISPMTLEDNDEIMTQFKTNLDKFKAKLNQEGGKHKSKKHHKKHKKDDSSDSSDLDSSDEFYKRAVTYVPSAVPLYYWWYDPLIYRLDSLFIPTFYSYVTPFIHLNLKLNN